MYSIIHMLLSDKKGGEIFTLFSAWHFFYIALTVVTAVVLLFVSRNKNEDAKKKLCRLLSSVAFGLYVADFFLMPLAYHEINVEKLPFHVCTAMCTMLFLSYRISYLEKFRTSFALLGFVSNLVYTIYPAGVMWHAVHPLSYRVVQTLLFHSLMCVCSLLTFVYERNRFERKAFLRDVGVLVCMTLWALLGNYSYNHVTEERTYFFNWFFVVRDPFNAFPENVAPFIMPFLNFAMFFVAETIIYFTIISVKRINKKSISVN